MSEESLPYWQRYDWDGDGDVDEDDASVYLSQHLLIRLTDPDKNPLPFALCRVVGDTEPTVYECDEDGVAHIPKPENDIATIDLEWEPEGVGGSERFFWKGTFNISVSDKNDDACSLRLTNLGFEGATLKEQVRAYQTYFNRPTEGNIAEIRDEMVDWHDGGEYPRTKTVEIMLLDDNLEPVPNVRCRIVNEPDIYTGNSDGIVQIPVRVTDSIVDIEWDGYGNSEEDETSGFYMQQTVTIGCDGDGEVSISRKLSNLGFDGDSLDSQFRNYQAFFGKTLIGDNPSDREELSQWVSKDTSPVSADVNSTEESSSIV